MRRLPLISLLALVVVLASVLAYVMIKPAPPPVAAEVATELDPILAVSSKVEKATFPITITDDMSRQVDLAKLPERIVSLAPSCTEILFALGLGDKVVGVSDWCDYPEELKEKVRLNPELVVTSYYWGTDPELITKKYMGTDPDLITANEHALILTDGYAPIGATLEGLGLTMIALQPKDIAGILKDIALVGRVTGKEKEAGELIAQMQKRISDVARKVPAQDRPWVFYEIDASDPSRPWTAGPGSFIDSLITLAGGQNIVREAREPAYFTVSLETLVIFQPEIIILGDTPYATPEEVRQRPGAWQQLDAVKSGRVYAISSADLTSRTGPRIVEGLEEMMRYIHPELAS